MWRLHQYPLCPFSRKVRFACAVKGITVELVREYPWERRDAFAALNPAGQTPVIQNGTITLVDSAAICDYFEETVDRTPLLGAGPEERAEARRLVAWFDQKFYAEVTAPPRRISIISISCSIAGAGCPARRSALPTSPPQPRFRSPTILAASNGMAMSRPGSGIRR